MNKSIFFVVAAVILALANLGTNRHSCGRNIAAGSQTALLYPVLGMNDASDIRRNEIAVTDGVVVGEESTAIHGTGAVRGAPTTSLPKARRLLTTNDILIRIFAAGTIIFAVLLCCSCRTNVKGCWLDFMDKFFPPNQPGPQINHVAPQNQLGVQQINHAVAHGANLARQLELAQRNPQGGD